MKILCAEYNGRGKSVIVTLGDDTLLRNNDDLYLPQFSRRFSCVPQLVLRISRLGKGIGRRFAGRYFEEIGLGIRFYADDFEEELARDGLPAIAASSFAESAALSPLTPKEDCAGDRFCFLLDGEEVYAGQVGAERERMEELVSLASDFHTMKIGDFLYCGSPVRRGGLAAGDRLQFSLGGRMLMDFRLR